jgi:hypothetical protein
MELDDSESDKTDISFEENVRTPGNSVWGCSSFAMTARKLDFSTVPEVVIEVPPSPIKSSPPLPPMRYLKLTENPSTPSTIFHNSGRRILHLKCDGRLSAPNLNPFTPEGMSATSRKRSRTQLSGVTNR